MMQFTPGGRGVPWAALCAFPLLIAGCGAHRVAVSQPTVASVAGQSITRDDVRRYLDYTTRYYSNPRTALPGSSPLQCSSGSASWACTVIQRQVLARLIQERAVAAYARGHGISLSASDRAGVHADLQQPAVLAAGDANLVRSVLQTEMLVQRVEDAVVPASLTRGPSFHLVKYTFSVKPRSNPAPVYAQALDLATNGSSPGAGIGERTEWQATFRVPKRVRQALAYAVPHQFVGPFRMPHGYLVVQLLKRADHRYGLPARDQKATAFFRDWLARQVHMDRPRCYDSRGKPQGCPL